VAATYQLGFAAPGGFADRAGECVDAPGTWESAMKYLVEWQVRGEGGGEFVAVEEQEPVARRQDRRYWCAGRRVGDQGGDRFALVRRVRWLWRRC
jgi:hypothetical protein